MANADGEHVATPVDAEDEAQYSGTSSVSGEVLGQEASVAETEGSNIATPVNAEESYKGYEGEDDNEDDNEDEDAIY
jgi:hypothetical protein